ncbi:ABC transporter permease [Gorillibacterium sp. sgz5001074]|uniref:ABC transporter permease n=1 Tax=Gorillibacterium sp. sgz5001074 TaxID=3446695 RepID=UPI003F67C713
MWAICRKELQMYFYSPVAYVAFAFYFLLTGFFFANDFLSSFQVDIRPMFSNMILFYLFIIPLLTMRLVSDELRQGTDELLLTSPANITEIILGKYAAAVIVQFLLVALSLLYPAIMATYGTLDQPVLWLSYLSLFLLGAAMMAVGLFCSTLSSHQMVAGIAAFAMLLLMWVIDWMGYSLYSSGRDFFTQFSIVQRLNNLQKGIFDLPDVLFYVTLSVLFLVLSIQTLERKRWR